MSLLTCVRRFGAASHTLILTLKIDVVEMEFVKLLSNFELSINNNPSCIRKIGTVISTASVKP